ncbi:hypothetical protein GW17_00048753 [Ensete ventricosum]|uniref:Uncharacterized protein n=1 Tax=Ensete ventricosum TaxID=4639 RepID=A0A427B0U9_ENSVE|nr:hypothetical protein B296_00020837 [Ensete ventricosum]RWV89120.1 hypothetical protein GW17_00048753 [Ensete ventricosum]
MTSRLQHAIPLQSFPRRSPSSSSPARTPLRLPQPFVLHRRRAITILLIPWSPHATWMGRRRRRTALVSCTVAERDGEDGPGRGGTAASAAEPAARWASLIPRGVGVNPERILRLISGATSSPICQFIEYPSTFLHSVDPRIKLLWLLVLVVLPARSHIYMRLGLVLYITLLSICVLPSRIWMIFQSASLCLTTTPPEQLASALRWFMVPLSLVGVPVSEIILTLLLSLRFISLVFDEVS